MNDGSVSFKRVDATDSEATASLSKLASRIVREHFDPIIGKAQNDYMIARFQSEEAITGQLRDGYRYYFVVSESGERLGFLAFYPRKGKMYLSKFYLDSSARGKGTARAMLGFVIRTAEKENLSAVYLNVNRNNFDTIAVYEHLGFKKIAEEKNDIGEGFVMDDFVMEYPLITPDACSAEEEII